MFISSFDYKAHIKKLIAESDTVDFAVAFWGKGADVLAIPGKRFRILCNLISGGTNPAEIEALGELHEVRHLDDLHAKVIIGDFSAIVGSANMSSNGLNIQETEFSGWQEAGYVTESAEDLLRMREWFAEQWTRSAEITPAIMRKAQTNWDMRFKTRISRESKAQDSLVSVLPEQLEGRDIFIAFWEESSDNEMEEAIERDDEYRAALVQNVNSEREWDSFVDWEEIKLDQIVIPIKIGNGNEIEVQGAYKIFDVKESVRQREWRKGKRMTLHYAYKLDEVFGFKFEAMTRKKLSDQIKKTNYARELVNKRKCFIPLEEFVREMQHRL